MRLVAAALALSLATPALADWQATLDAARGQRAGGPHPGHAAPHDQPLISAPNNQP